MKQLTEYDTPENQRLTGAMNGSDDASHIIALDALSCDLERRLAACRVNLACISAAQILDAELQKSIRETLDLTKPPQ